MLRRFIAAACWLLALTLLVYVLLPVAAFADEAATTIQVPIGDWIAKSGAVIGYALSAVLLWLIRKLPGNIVDIIRTMRAEQLLTKAIDYGINAAADAAKDKKLSVNVGNSVLAQAAQYAIDNGPGWMIGWLGGETAIRQKIIARLNLDESASVVSLGGQPVLVGKS